LSQEEIEALLGDPLSFTGNAKAQTEAVVSRIHHVVGRHHEAAKYRPSAIL
jgi:adenylosuccinate lyase